MFRPLTVYDKTKTPDSSGGGFTWTLTEASTVYGHTALHEDEVVLQYRLPADLSVGQIITADGQDYEIGRIIGPTAARTARATLEKIERPIDG